MSRVARMRILVLFLCVGFSYLLAAGIRGDAHGAVKAVDFASVYYAARCGLQHKDAYDPETVLREFDADGGKLPNTRPGEDRIARDVITKVFYPPTALLLAFPLALLPWNAALTAWMSLVAGLMVAVAFLMWDLAGGAPVAAGVMTCFMLLNCVLLLLVGNPAGVAVPACVIAAWCIFKERFAGAGVVLLAIALVVKPHDAGFVWLYFLLAGGAGRKRAWQALMVAALVGAFSLAWIAPSSPHWIQEEHNNIASYGVRGGGDDPGPTGLSYAGPFPIISMQNAVSTLSNDPNFYDPLSYGIVGGVILWWMVAVLRKRPTRNGALLALAAVSCLTLLVGYHRPHDAKLLLLAIPACAVLWAGGGAKRWVALGLTGTAIFVTSDFPLFFLSAAQDHLAISDATFSGKLALLLLHPAPLVLLAAACFYLWIYVRHKPVEIEAVADLEASLGRTSEAALP